MYLHSIRLENIRGFRGLTIELGTNADTPRLWTVLVGANGTGKTTLLRALALGLASEADANAMLTAPVGQMVSSGQTFGTIALTASERPGSDPAVFTTIIKASGDRESVHREPVPDWASKEAFVAGYGIARLRAGKEMYRGRRVLDSTQSLFDYDARLTPVELTLRRISDHMGTKAYDAVMSGIKMVLKLPDETQIVLPAGGGVQVSGGPIEQPIPIDGWADGFRLNLAWIIDFFGVALAANALATDGTVEGILLLDEIEQHTHPSIQDTLIGQLKALWPRLQVVATTHSPLVVLGANADEVAVLKRDAEGAIFQASRPSTFQGYTAEDILNDKRIFNTESRSAEDEVLVDEYKSIAAVPAERRSTEQNERLASLAKGIGGTVRPSTSGSTLESLGAGDRYDGSIDKQGPATIDPAREAELVDELRRLRVKYNL
jgi:energy-coupling factor transporter ATP-binding protein EcfA2